MSKYRNIQKRIYEITEKEKKEELLITVFITFLLLLVAATVMYYIEHDLQQPDKFQNTLSSFWWAMATLTTVGYGDVIPLTGWGKLLSSIIAILGIGLVALPTGILSSGFVEELNKKKKKENEKDAIIYCPYCGKKIKK